MLGSSIVPAFEGGGPAQATAAPDGSDACAAEPDAGMFGGSNYIMPTGFCNEMARALVEDDLVSYNGHIWTSEDEQPTVPGEPAEVNGTTLKLVQRMQDLRKAGAPRTKQSIVYMNACHAERIEQKMMEGLIDQGTPDAQQPLLLSHRNYSNFGYFAEHDAVLMIDLLGGRPLPKVMLDLTTTLRQQSLANLGGVPLGSETADQAKQILAQYVQRPEVRMDPKNVIIVAYDVKDGRVVKAQDGL